uniref:Tudor domain-containing protein n=1 Tax=Romanomermis culicivorax TaxID=13658 RepID=A0A915JV07_ROMCU
MSEKELSEMWDDTSLIEAYDKAVGLAYDAVHAKLDGKLKPTDADAFKEPKPVVNGKTSSKKAKKNRKKWQVGEKCLAKYDGEWHKARILDVCRSHNKCTIKFDGYETELPEKDDISNDEVTDRSGSGNESASEMSSSSVNDLEKQNPETSKKTTKNFPQMVGEKDNQKKC